MTSRRISIRPDNIPSDGKISFKNGFPILSFTIQSQMGVLDLRSIRVNGNLQIFKDNLADPTPVYETDADDTKVTMDNRLGVYNLFEQLVVRHNKSKSPIETIRHYQRYLSSYLGMSSSKQDLLGMLNETALIMPDPDVFFRTVVANEDGVTADNVKKSFSVHLPSGFLQNSAPLNIMESGFGGIQLELHLSPDANALFNPIGDSSNIADAHYRLTDLSLTCEITDIPPEDMAQLSSESQGQIEFNTITSLYTTINSTNAQLQFALGLKEVQSVFLNFCPSGHINNLKENGLATTYPSKSNGDLVHFKRVQWLRGGVKYPCEYDIVTNIDKDANTLVVDPQLLKSAIDSVIPDYVVDRCAVSTQNNYRGYNLTTTGDDAYTKVRDSGALFLIGQKYSQFNTGQDFSRQQWGLSLESDLTDDSPQSVFIYVKARAVLVWNQSGVQLLQ